MKNVFFAAFFGAACCLSGCRQEAATPATGEHYAFAEEMFRKVWDMYRVPEYGLFSEYYPNSYRPDVNYFDDGAKSTQEVSFLWPMDGVFTSAVALAEVDPVKYGCYVDSMVMAVEQYYDDGRMPAGYQAYPVRMGKVDRYYDDNGLVGLAYVAAYGVTRNPAHLEKAKQVMTFILSGWRPDHDGAVSWLEGVENQKPGCANGKAMLLALNLYGATGDPYYLTAGRRFYDWMDAYLHDPELDIVWNSWLTQPEARLDKRSILIIRGCCCRVPSRCMGIPAIVFIWTMPAGWPKEPGNSICRRRRTARPRTVICRGSIWCCCGATRRFTTSTAIRNTWIYSSAGWIGRAGTHGMPPGCFTTTGRGRKTNRPRPSGCWTRPASPNISSVRL